MYFWDWARSWADITEQVRNRLITVATTQVRRNDYESIPLSSEFKDIDPILFGEILSKISLLSENRLKKGGRKSYDLMVAGYFNDMAKVTKQVYSSLKPDGQFILVLGDSAPYSVYIPVEEYLGRLGVGLGFQNYKTKIIRKRGEKWEHNSQRHKIALKESILFLQK